MSLESTELKQAAVRTWLGSGSINVFGIQFSGKDTQLRRLEAWMGGVILGGGEISRQIMSELSPEVRAITLAGGLIPKDAFLNMITPVFSRSELKGKPLLLSAVGRWHGEEDLVFRAANAAGHRIRAAVWLDLDEQAVWQRWKLMTEKKDREARVDDAADGLRKRLEEYRNKTLPVRDFYQRLGILISIDGSKDPDQVQDGILNGLYTMSLNDRSVASD